MAGTNADAEHGLLVGAPLPSVSELENWLDNYGVVRHPGVRIAPMADGTGWRLRATADLEVGETRESSTLSSTLVADTPVCKIPKTALLSLRTSSLPPLSIDVEPHTLLVLALALLHELRLGTDSPFWGYIQSLPRETVPLPMLWPLHPPGSDGARALPWLSGTEGERDMARREAEGVGLSAAREFYAAAAPSLPPTKAHPSPSPFAAYAHACALVSTRAFVVDLWHTVALCPFADVLNHSAAPHTSLASDDFVCHRCGGLAPCEHDVCRPGSDIPLRLEHLGEHERMRVQGEVDTVDMYIESRVRSGREVMNSYGDDLGEARLLVEWGFVPGWRPAMHDDDSEDEGSDGEEGEDEFSGDGITWTLTELLPPAFVHAWAAMGEGDSVAASLFESDGADAGKAEAEADSDSDDALLCAPSLRSGYHLSHAGQLSLRNFGALYLASAVRAALGTTDVAEIPPNTPDIDSDELLADLLADVNHLEATWAASQEGEDAPPLRGVLRDTVLAVRDLLRARIGTLAGGERSLSQMFDLREVSKSTSGEC